MKIATQPPKTLEQLLERAERLSGLTLGELAEIASIAIPKDFKQEKGWAGQLIELMLGAEAGSRPQQDFPDLGVELKTIPIDQQGHPLETTYVCYAPLTNISGVNWQNSNVRNKLNCVLWIPIEGNRQILPSNRRVAFPILWRPNQQQSNLLRQDWEELMDLIALGEVESITARHGQILQLRPKAADGKALTDAIGNQGQPIKVRPRGFYLRKDFTAQIIQQAFSE